MELDNYYDITKLEELKRLRTDMEYERTEFGNKVVAVSGFFDPMHEGHVEYLKMAYGHGAVLVILNTDNQAILKKGAPFMQFRDRLAVAGTCKYVLFIVPSIDTDASVCETLALLKPDIFAKGGDRFVSNVPEVEVCKEHGISLIDGLGEKIQSSSSIIRSYSANK